MGPHGMAEGAGEAVSTNLVRAGGISLLLALFHECNRKHGPGLVGRRGGRGLKIGEKVYISI